MPVIRLDRPGGYALVCGLALVAVAAVYGNHFQNDFHFDDHHTITNNLYIRDLRNIPLFFSTPSTISALPANQSYRPLLLTTLALDYRIGGGGPIAFHATSFALFVVQCAAMLFLYRRIMDRARPFDDAQGRPFDDAQGRPFDDAQGRPFDPAQGRPFDPAQGRPFDGAQGRLQPAASFTSNRWMALFATAWYALHTANAETVNYIIARSEILSTLGAVLAVSMFARGGRTRAWGLYLIPAAASVFAKEQGAMTAPLLFLYAALFDHELPVREWLRPRRFLTVLRDVWPAFVVCGLVLVNGLRLATAFMAGGSEISRWQYLLAQPFVIVHYVFTFFLPVNLSADTDWKPIANVFDDRVLAGAILLASGLWLIVVTSRRRATRPVAYGLLWFFVALLPTSSVVPLAEVTNDHRMYFPFVGLTLAVVWALALAIERRHAILITRWWAKPALTAAAVGLLAAHGAGTRQRNEVWRTEEALWFDVIQKSPENGRGLMTYGVIQMGKGNLETAQYYFERALQYVPRYAYLHVNLGVLKGALGQAAEAERHFQEAQQYDPGNPVSYVYYARWLDSVGRRDEAILLLKRSIELSPADLGARDLLRAVEERRQAIAPAPPQRAGETVPDQDTPERWLTLSLAQYRAGRYQDCIESSRRALDLRPDYAEAYNNICAAQNALGRYADAVAACERALAIKPDFPLARNNLASAQASLK